MKIVYLLLLLAPAVCSATSISIDGVPLTIPNPSDFSPVTQQMELLYDLQKQFVAPANEEYVAFIPARDVPAVLKDDIPDLPRRFTVQTAKSLIAVSVSSTEFIKLKDIVKSQNDELMKKVEARLPGLMKDMNEGIKQKYDINLAFSVSQMVPFPAHEETDRTLSYSSLVKYDVKDENGNPAPFVVAVTTTFAHVKGKVLFLYSYAEETGLEWSKNASREWARKVIAANPSNFEAAMKEALPSAVTGIDWENVGVKAVVGAVIGLMIGLVGWIINRGKSS